MNLAKNQFVIQCNIIIWEDNEVDEDFNMAELYRSSS